MADWHPEILSVTNTVTVAFCKPIPKLQIVKLGISPKPSKDENPAITSDVSINHSYQAT